MSEHTIVQLSCVGNQAGKSGMPAGRRHYSPPGVQTLTISTVTANRLDINADITVPGTPRDIDPGGS